VVWTFAYFGKQARYFVSLLDRLGYHARLKEIPSGGRYFPALDRTPSVQAGFAGWFGIFVAADMFETLHCGASTNWARFCDRRIEAEVRRLTREESTNPSTDASLAAKIDRQLVAQTPWVPLFTRASSTSSPAALGTTKPTPTPPRPSSSTSSGCANRRWRLPGSARSSRKQSTDIVAITTRRGVTTCGDPRA
jgi:ABC-type transport system substrate-binding protein